MTEDGAYALSFVTLALVLGATEDDAVLIGHTVFAEMKRSNAMGTMSDSKFILRRIHELIEGEQ